MQTVTDDLEKYNAGLGTMIRLYLLRLERVLYKRFVEEGFTGRDEMAMEIIRGFHQYMNQKI